MTPKLILASGSPRRRELMTLTGIPFAVDVPEVNEDCDLPAREAVAELCCRKARAAAAMHPGEVVLAADTLVSVDNVPLGKPHDEEDAFRMLKSLSGRWHQVYTGVACVDKQGNLHVDVDGTDVRFGEMTDEEIRRYIATGEPMDKAGAYGIQGGAGAFVEALEGSYENVIGFPVDDIREMLANFITD